MARQPIQDMFGESKAIWASIGKHISTEKVIKADKAKGISFRESRSSYYLKPLTGQGPRRSKKELMFDSSLG